MANVKAKMSVLQGLTKTDHQVLMAIYKMRCLDEVLIYEYFYKKDGQTEEYSLTRIDFFIENCLLDSIEYGGDVPALFLTTEGIQTVKTVFDIPPEKWDPVLQKMRPSMKSASQLRIKPLKIRHQIHLNGFVLHFRDLAEAYGLPYKYMDEISVNGMEILHTTTFRPDGLITLSNCDIFLEMDMATERVPQLARKWEHYRSYLNTKEFAYKENPTIVLFITSNTRRTRLRRDTVLSTLNNSFFDQISPKFEFFIGDEETLIALLKDRFIDQYSAFSQKISSLQSVLMTYHGFSSSLAYNLVTDLEDTVFDLYIRKLNERKNILVVDGKPQEFLVDYYINEPISVLKKIAFFKAATVGIRAQFGREISYLVVVDDIKSLYRDLSVLDIRSEPNVFFTTEERLRMKLFPEAIFQFDGLGNLFHFSDEVYNKPVFEQKMRF